MNLPADLLDFLIRGLSLNYPAKMCECGAVKLKRAESLAVEFVVLDTYSSTEGDCDSGIPIEDVYEVEIVSLIADCEDYDPHGILVWYPQAGKFGSFDAGSEVGLIFPHANWSDIVSNPLLYLNSIWGSDEDWGGLIEPLLPWKHFRAG